jgi:hypothetical protein
MSSSRRLPTQYQGPSSSIPYTLQCAWATAITGTPTVTAYKGTTDVSGTVLSDNNTISGNALTLKKLGALTGGEEYVIEVVMTVDGITDTWWLPVVCLKAASGLKA